MKTTKLYILITAIFIVLAALVVLQAYIKHNSSSVNQSPKYSINLFYVESGKGWGYDILENDKVIIHQDIIPAITDSRPFLSMLEAKKIGTLVIEKLEKQQKPYISIAELKKLGIRAE
jgi:hypothetical protein